jgi:two-component system, chemotaxis family, protein-glutamate methylesterase/glutaminase
VRARDVIVIGASAGGVENLSRLVGDLPGELAAAVFVVLHIPAAAPSVLADILDRHTELRAGTAEDGEDIVHGRIYVAPSDCHLLVRAGRVEVVKGPKENGHRPAVDPLFRTAADAYGDRVIGVVLSGMLDDGAAGLAAIKSAGGAAVVLDPATTVYTGMPSSALRTVTADVVAPIGDLGARILQVMTGPSGNADEDVGDARATRQTPRDGAFELDDATHWGHASGFSCPDCGSALWQVDESDLVRFRCHVGHAYSLESVATAQDEALDRALFSAIRALREKAAMARHLSRGLDGRGAAMGTHRLRADARQAEDAAESLRLLVADRSPRAAVPDELTRQAER